MWMNAKPSPPLAMGWAMEGMAKLPAFLLMVVCLLQAGDPAPTEKLGYLRLAQAETKAALKDETSKTKKETEAAPKTKIRTRSPQSDQPSPAMPDTPEKAPSIDPDAQKGLVDRMKGCCPEPKN